MLRRFGGDVLERTWGFRYAVDVRTGFMGECVPADERFVFVEGEVGGFVDGTSRTGEIFDILPDAVEAELELQDGDDGVEIGVSAAFADAGDGPLYLRHARKNGRNRAGHRHAEVVVAVDADVFMLFCDSGTDHADDVREHAAVGVTEDDTGSTRTERGVDDAHGIDGIVGVTVEKVFGIEDDFLARRLHKGDAVVDHAEIFPAGGLQDVCDLVFPRLAVKDGGGDVTLRNGAECGIFGCFFTGAAGLSEDGELRIFQLHFGKRMEKRMFRGIVGHHAGFNIGYAETVERVNHAQLVVGGKLHSGTLFAVAERCIKNFDFHIKWSYLGKTFSRKSFPQTPFKQL